MPFEVNAKASTEFNLKDEVLNYVQVLKSSQRLTAPNKSSPCFFANLPLSLPFASSLKFLNMGLVLLGIPYLKSCLLMLFFFLSQGPWTWER